MLGVRRRPPRPPDCVIKTDSVGPVSLKPNKGPWRVFARSKGRGERTQTGHGPGRDWDWAWTKTQTQAEAQCPMLASELVLSVVLAQWSETLYVIDVAERECRGTGRRATGRRF